MRAEVNSGRVGKRSGVNFQASHDDWSGGPLAAVRDFLIAPVMLVSKSHAFRQAHEASETDELRFRMWVMTP